MSKQYTFEDFIEIIAALRGENGCPWDKVQTHESLKPCVMEEAAELVSSIRIYEQSGNAENMCEELGDLLLQVVMHSQIAEEEGLFSIADVVQGISEKMVRRHPHVFGTGEADTPDAVLETWDEIKKKEKEGKSWIDSPLREIPKELPSLSRAPKVLKKSKKLYDHLQERNLQQCAAALEEELLAENIATEAVCEQIGSLLIQIADIAAQLKLPAEQILTDKIEELIEIYEPLPK